MSETGLGILACGAYVPRGRLSHALLAEVHGWFDPSIGKAGGSRSFCNWDEDAVTMGVEAARDALARYSSNRIHALDLTSTTLPFNDRSNAGIAREALALPAQTRVADSGGSLRAASSALMRALAEPGAGPRLIIASDAVDTRPASGQEASVGHAAAALIVGEGEPLAKLLGAESMHQDFVDHYRSSGQRFDYTLEARWARDEGYRERIQTVVDNALSNAGLDAADIDRVAVAAPQALVRPLQKLFAGADAVAAELTAALGFCGAAQAALVTIAALERAERGDRIAVLTVGQGIDVLLLEVCRSGAGDSLRRSLTNGVDESNYTRYLSMRRLLELDGGIRAERDNRSSQAAAWRKHDALTGFVGGLCQACNTLQFPASRLCVSCGAEDSQTPKRLADLPGRVRSFTEDWLAATPRPPLIFGNVGFEHSANVMMEFTDTDAGQLAVGMPVRMQFRIKDFDDRRHYRRYFWKPVPETEEAVDA